MRPISALMPESAWRLGAVDLRTAVDSSRSSNRRADPRGYFSAIPSATNPSRPWRSSASARDRSRRFRAPCASSGDPRDPGCRPRRVPCRGRCSRRRSRGGARRRASPPAGGRRGRSPWCRPSDARSRRPRERGPRARPRCRPGSSACVVRVADLAVVVEVAPAADQEPAVRELAPVLVAALGVGRLRRHGAIDRRRGDHLPRAARSEASRPGRAAG